MGIMKDKKEKKSIHSVIFTTFLIYLIFSYSQELYAKELRIITSICSLGSIAREILGESGEVISIGDGRFDLHKIEPRPSFLYHLSRADYVIPVGMRLDTWFMSMIDSSGNSKIYPGSKGFIITYDRLEILEIPEYNIGQIRTGDIHPEGNPHYWLLPENALKIAEIIANKLSEENPDKKDYFLQRYSDFRSEIEKLVSELRDMFKNFYGVKVVAYHNSWRYFEKFLGFEVIEFLEPAPGIPPTPSQVQKVINTIRENNVKVILYEPFQPISQIRFISERTQAKPVEIYQDCVPKIKDISDYKNLLIYNTKKLIDGLK